MRLFLVFISFALMTFSAVAQASVCAALVSATGISSKHMDLMRTHSAGFMSFEEFLKNPPQNGYLLGRDDSLYHLVQKKSGLPHWEETYKKFGIGTGESRHTEKFMSTLTAQHEPIYFLVPRLIWAQAPNTARELWWLLSHPNLMGNVTFVFEK